MPPHAERFMTPPQLLRAQPDAAAGIFRPAACCLPTRRAPLPKTEKETETETETETESETEPEPAAPSHSHPASHA